MERERWRRTWETETEKERGMYMLYVCGLHTYIHMGTGHIPVHTSRSDPETDVKCPAL